MTFEKLNLIEPIKQALKKQGYTTPTPIQQKAIPAILEGSDILGCARTGTGKTAAFAIPVLQMLSIGREQGRPKRRLIKALVLTPTRELAHQVSDSFMDYGFNSGLKNTVVYGGVSQRSQTDKLKRGVDILIATPGRLLDLVNQKYIDLSNIEILVLDEADRMLDMGFIHDIKRIIEKVPKNRQTLFFSATMPPEITKLAGNILTNPVKIEITTPAASTEVIKQGVYFVSRPDKKKLLIHLLKNEAVTSALVFTRTKHVADIVTRHLNDARINADAIHGNKSQGARQRALNNFKLQKTKVLVATDIASRGIDIDRLSHVFNFDMPDFAETYVHRIGRTGRAGMAGTALSFCDSEERYYLKEINKFIKSQIPIIPDHPYPMDEAEGGVIALPPVRPKGKSKKFSFSKKKNFGSNQSKNRKFKSRSKARSF